MNTKTLLDPEFLAQLDRLAVVSRRLRRGQIQGERRSPNRGGSVEFADFRAYSSGDDFRQIDWNAYARLEKLFIKLFVAEEDITLHFVLDASSSMAWGDPEKWAYARRLVAALGYVGLVGMDRVTGAAIGGNGNRPDSHRDFRAHFPPHRGKRQALAWFDWLSNMTTGGSLDPVSALGAYLAQARHPGPLLLVSDLLGPGWEQALRALAARSYEVTVLHLLAPQEVAPTLEGDLQLVDSETQGIVEITADYDLLQRYRARVEAWQEHLRQTCAKIGVHYVFIETSQPLASLILTYLRRYHVVA
jgi:uncharacterized protein (DUF58 family)